MRRSLLQSVRKPAHSHILRKSGVRRDNRYRPLTLEPLEPRTLLSGNPLIVSTTVDELDGDYSQGDLSLREALLLAGAVAGDDVICFDSRLAGSTLQLDPVLGQLNVDSNVTIEGLGAGQLAIDGGGTSRVFSVVSGVTAAISGLAITGGSGDNGGGINNSGTLTITDATISGNSAGNGGGIYNSGGLTVSRTTVTANSAGQGGGIANWSNYAATLTDVEISDNSASGNGGGIWNRWGTLIVSHGTICKNSASGSSGGGGGIYNSGPLTLSSVMLSGNSALGYNAGGGGIYHANNLLTLSNSTISDNSAERYGGGIYQSWGQGSLSNITISGNTSGVWGGGIYHDGGALIITNGTISGNLAGGAGGIMNSYYGRTGLTMYNTIVAGNVQGGDVSGAFELASSYNLIGIIDGSTGLAGSGTLYGTAGAPLDPMLGPLADNGGTTLTLALLPGSPAIEAGSNERADEAGLIYDQRGLDRFSDAGGDGVPTVDIGAYEFQAPENMPPTMTSLMLRLGTIAENGTATLFGTFVDWGTVEDSHTLVVDWGAGETTDTLVLPTGTKNFTVVHRYLDDDPSETSSDVYVIAATLSDDDGSASAATTVRVNNVPPVIPTPSGISAVPGKGCIYLAGQPDGTRGPSNDSSPQQSPTLVHLAGAQEIIVTATGAVWGGLPPEGAPDFVFATSDAYESFGISVATAGWGGLVGVFLGDGPPDPAQLPPRVVGFIPNPELQQGFFIGAGPVSIHVPAGATRLFLGTHDGFEWNNNWGSFQVTVDRVGVASALSLERSVIEEGDIARLAVGFIDPGTLDQHTAVVSWGDGTSDTLTLAAGTRSIFAEHRYSSGTYAIAVTVTDDDGGSGTAATSIAVSNAPPAIIGLTLDQATIDENGTTTLAVTFSDPGTRDRHSAVVDWGDGTTETVDIALGERAFWRSHQYLDDNPSGTSEDTYPISVSVTDDDGGAAQGSTQVTVLNLDPLIVHNVALIGTYTVPATACVYLAGVEYEEGGLAWDTTPANSPVLINLSGAQEIVVQATGLASWGHGSPPAWGPDGELSYWVTTEGRYGQFGISVATAPVIGLMGVFLTDAPPDPSLVPPGLSDFTSTPQIQQAFAIGSGPVSIQVPFGATRLFLGTQDGLEWINNQGSFDVAVFDAALVGPGMRVDCWKLDERAKVMVSAGILDSGSLDTHTVTIDWGDGSPATSLTRPVGHPGFLAVHEYLPPDPGAGPSGAYSILVTITDDDTGVASSSATVTPFNVSPTVEVVGAPSISPEGAEITLAGVVSDPNTGDTFTYLWSVIKDGEAYNPGTPTDEPDFTFTPDDNGTFVVSVTVTDDDGGVGADAKTVTVTNVRPETTSLSAVPAEMDEGGWVMLTGTFDDPGDADTFTLSVDWGEGDPETVDLAAGERSFALTHQYLDDNPSGTSSDVYRITVTLTDDDMAGIPASGNVALGGDVVLYGEFFATDTWPPEWSEGIEVSPTTVVDGVFVATGSDWNRGPVWWDEHDGQHRYLTITFDATYAIESLVVQADNNDAYKVSYWDGQEQTWKTGWDVPNYKYVAPWGMRTRPNPYDDSERYMLPAPILTDRLRLEADLSAETDLWFAVSEIQAFTPPPAAATTTVTVRNVSPTVAILGAPSQSPEGTAIILPSQVTDAGVLDTFTYAWNVSKDGEAYDSGTPTDEPDFTFTPDDNGTFVVSVTVTDDDGGPGTATQGIEVTNVAPAIDLSGETRADEGSPYTLVLGAVADPGNDTVNEYIVNWGDATSSTYDHSGEVTHVYVEGPATVAITVALVDEDGTHLEAGRLDLTVNNVAPRLADATFAIPENSPVGRLVGTVTGTDPGADTLTYWITGGSGATAFAIDAATGKITVADAGQLDFESHPSLTLEVEVTDGDPGGVGKATVTINLLNEASITGVVFVDANQNGLYEANEPGIDGVAIELLDEFGAPVLDTLGNRVTATTSSGGFYLFEDLGPGTYQLHEIQPSGVDDGAEILGSLGGTIPANDTMQLTLARTDAADYIFAELGQNVTSGDTATIGFWQNKHGQALIARGGTALADWLTEHFDNVFGDTFSDGVGSDDGLEVAAFFKDQLFRQKSTKSAGPAKVDAQFMAVALASYFTSLNLAGNLAADFGFNVTDTGIGTKIVNVTDNGAAFAVADGTDLTIMQLLLATNGLTDNVGDGSLSGFAHIYDRNGDGTIDSAEAALRVMANDVYSAINEAGSI